MAQNDSIAICTDAFIAMPPIKRANVPTTVYDCPLPEAPL